MSESDFNAHIPGAPRAGCTAADKGQALWDVMTVLAGRRALGSVHADETRGGMEEIESIRMLTEDVSSSIRDSDGLCEYSTLLVEHEDSQVGKRVDFLVFDHDWTAEILKEYKLGGYWEARGFLHRSLTEIFPLGSSERNAIDEMYGEDSQSKWTTQQGTL